MVTASEPIILNPAKVSGAGVVPVTIPSEPDMSEISQAARQIARQHFDMCGGDRNKAMESLAGLIKQREDVAEALVAFAFRELWRHLLRECSGKERMRITRQVNNNIEAWSPPADTGAGIAAVRRNNAMIFDYQWPLLGKKIGLATKIEFATAGQLLKHRYDTDQRMLDLHEAIKKKMIKADKDAVIQDSIDADDLARLFCQHGIVT